MLQGVAKGALGLQKTQQQTDEIGFELRLLLQPITKELNMS